MKNQRKTSKNARGHYRNGWWSAVAVCVVGLLLALPPRGVLAAQMPLAIDLSFNIGPIAAQLDITKPVARPGGMFSSTLHVHGRDDTQTPAFIADLVSPTSSLPGRRRMLIRLTVAFCPPRSSS